MRKLIAVCVLALGTMSPALAQVTVQIGVPDVRIDLGDSRVSAIRQGAELSRLLRTAGSRELLFYDGLYWVYRNGNWYASYWYNGPWGWSSPTPFRPMSCAFPCATTATVRSVFSSTWRVDAPPRWVEVWGPEWEQRRSGWDRWNRSAAPAPAHCRSISGSTPATGIRRSRNSRYLQSRYYSFQPRDPVVRQYYSAPGRPGRIRDSDPPAGTAHGAESREAGKAREGAQVQGAEAGQGTEGVQGTRIQGTEAGQGAQG
jgi:hypothetical protein